jgi:hypothetical protein
VEACAKHLLENTGDNVQRWEQLIEKFEHFPKPAQDRLLQDLRAFDPNTLATDVRHQLSDVLRKKVSLHRYYSDANWAMPPETVNALEAIQKRFEPMNLVVRYAWLFDAHSHLFAGSREDLWEQREEAVFQSRREALEEILAIEGSQRVIELAKVVESPDSVGFVLGKARLLDNDREILPKLFLSDNDKLAMLARGYAWGCFADANWSWVEQLELTEWTAEQAGSLAAFVLPFERKTWGFVTQLGPDVSKHYWSRVHGFYRNATKDDVEYSVSMLLKHHRPFQAVRILQMALRQHCEVEPSLIIETLDTGLKPREEGELEATVSNHISYSIQYLFEWLQSDRNVDTQRLAALEWGYLGLLDGHGASPKALHGWLQRDPQLFVNLLSVIFRSKKEPTDAIESPTKEQKARAENAYKLLMLWKIVPGTREDGTVDDQKFLEWVNTARTLCEESGQLEVCDSRVGEVLAHAPEENDGSWPCIPVRDVIEEVASDELIRGFQIGIFNKRGVYSKSFAEGGEQERALAKKYAAYADACDIEWPKTAATLRRVAQRYEEDARREDEKTRDRLNRA